MVKQEAIRPSLNNIRDGPGDERKLFGLGFVVGSLQLSLGGSAMGWNCVGVTQGDDCLNTKEDETISNVTQVRQWNFDAYSERMADNAGQSGS